MSTFVTICVTFVKCSHINIICQNSLFMWSSCNVFVLSVNSSVWTLTDNYVVDQAFISYLIPFAGNERMLRSFILVVVFIQVLTAFVSVSCSLIACEVAAMMMNDSVEVILQCCRNDDEWFSWSYSAMLLCNDHSSFDSIIISDTPSSALYNCVLEYMTNISLYIGHYLIIKWMV